MNNKSVISTPNAPSAIGPYSQAIRAGNMLFVSGQIPMDPSTGKLIEDTEILVVYTDRPGGERRLISARKATSEERKIYWKAIASTQR